MAAPAAGGVSLRRRLWLAGFAGVVLTGVLSGLVLGTAYSRGLMEGFDRRLDEDLLTLARLAGADGDGSVRLRSQPQDERYARVFSGHYWLLSQPGVELRSRSLWDAALAVPAASPGQGARLVELAGPSGQHLRGLVQVLRVSGVSTPVLVLVASDVGPLRADVARFRLVAAGIGAVLSLALLALLASQVGYGLRPLRRLALTLEQVRSGARARLDAGSQPLETRPLAAEIDALLDQHAQAVERARRAGDDLAHGLKTPLAVLAAAAAGGAAVDAETVAGQVERMQQAIDRQLAAVRVVDPRQRTPVAPVATALAAMLAQVRGADGPAIAVEVPAALRFHGDRGELEDMLGNLMENAVAWARRQVVVSGSIDSGRLRLQVEDDGPGIPEAQLAAVLGRGHRLDQSQPGSGLGLAIAATLAKSHGGRLALHNRPQGGLCARLELPGSAAA